VRRLALIAIMAGVAATPASATEWIDCTATGGGDASFNFLTGASNELAIAGLTIAVGKDSWSSNPAFGAGTDVGVGQAFEDADSIRVDAIDEKGGARIAELRLFKAQDGDSDEVDAGTLKIVGHGAWAVSCVGP
jgi:hypothetical protein